MKLLYVEGDPNSPKYVAGALRHVGISPTVRESKRAGGIEGFDAIILSDATSEHLGAGRLRKIVAAVEAGTGLVVVGGWTSFGRGGYAKTPLAEILPVTLQDGDDRENVPSGLLLRPEPGAFWRGLRFSPPPVITGYNRCVVRPGSRVLLRAHRIRSVKAAAARLDAKGVPVLVVGSHGRGRVAALMTDLAPHWSGGWTDWGPKSVDVGHGEELGTSYVEFLRRLVAWAARTLGD